MICQNKETLKKFNCSFCSDDKVKLSDNRKKIFFVSIEEFNKNYNIIDKLLKL